MIPLPTQLEPVPMVTRTRSRRRLPGVLRKSKYFEGFFGSIVVDEPSRAFGYKKKVNKDNGWSKGLEQAGCSPSPLGIWPRQCAIAKPRSDNLADIIVAVIRGRNIWSQTRMRQFLKQCNAGDLSERSSRTDNDSTTNKCSNILRKSVKEC